MSIAGFNPKNVLTAEISLPELRYPDKPSQVNFFSELERRVTALPGVSHAGFTIILPMSGTNSDSSFEIEGRPNDDAHPMPDEEFRLVSSDYFRTLEMPAPAGPLLHRGGQARRARRRRSSTRRSRAAIGLTKFRSGNGFACRHGKVPVWATIVGIVGDLRHRGLDQPVKPELVRPTRPGSLSRRHPRRPERAGSGQPNQRASAARSRQSIPPCPSPTSAPSSRSSPIRLRRAGSRWSCFRSLPGSRSSSLRSAFTA